MQRKLEGQNVCFLMGMHIILTLSNQTRHLSSWWRKFSSKLTVGRITFFVEIFEHQETGFVFNYLKLNKKFSLLRYERIA